MPAAVRFLSCEPLIGPIDFDGLDCWPRHDYRPTYGYWRTWTGNPDPTPIKVRDGIDWCIVGGESGPGARSCDVKWIRSIVAQCHAAGVACFVKQLGSRWALLQHLVNRVTGDPKGSRPEGWPQDLRVREFPATADVPA